MSNPRSQNWNDSSRADWLLFDKSEAAQRILARRKEIESELRIRSMKVLPVRRVARLFGLSERLLWGWIERGIIRTRRQPAKNPEHYKKGITEWAVRDFLRRLAKCGEMSDLIEECRFISRPPIIARARPALKKCREGQEMLQDRELTPRQYAEIVGVSVSTVYRLLRDRHLTSYRPTKKRIRICHYFSSRRKSALTRKNR